MLINYMSFRLDQWFRNDWVHFSKSSFDKCNTIINMSTSTVQEPHFMRQASGPARGWQLTEHICSLSGNTFCQWPHILESEHLFTILVQVGKKTFEQSQMFNTHTWFSERLSEKPWTASGYSLKNQGTKRFSSSGSSDGRRHASPRWWRSSTICRNMFSSRLTSSQRHLLWQVNKNITGYLHSFTCTVERCYSEHSAGETKT